MAKVEFHVINLSNKDGCHSLVEGSAIHVDGGTHGQDEACHSLVHTVVLLQTAEGDGQGGRAMAGVVDNGRPCEIIIVRTTTRECPQGNELA